MHKSFDTKILMRILYTYKERKTLTMTINIKNKDPKDDSPIELNTQEFWQLFLTLRNNKGLTNKEIEILSEHLAGTQKAHKGNYKKYVTGLVEKGISLEPREAPVKSTIQIKINVT